MNYYPHHIGDFNNSTRHLTRVERSIYRDMIELYYDSEKPLPADVKALCRKLLARTEEEATAVEQVLNEFFTSTEQGWSHARCDEEIAKYHALVDKKSAAGKASAEARAAAKAASNQGLGNDDKANEQVFNRRSTNQEPITNNQEPVKAKAEKEKPQRASRLPADWTPSVEHIEFCKTERPELDPMTVAKTFKDHWLGTGGRKADWMATWRNWVRNERRMQPRASPPGKPEKFDPLAYVNRTKSQSQNHERTIEIDANGEPI